MATAPIGRPALKQNTGTITPGLTRSGQSDSATAANVFTGQQFVRISVGNNSETAGFLAPYIADDIAIYGLVPDKTHLTTDEPYTQPYGSTHNVIDPRGAVFLMNITDGSGTVGSGSTTQANVSVGTLYSAHYLASVDTGCLAVDASDTGTATKNIFRVVALWPEDATTDFNGRVLVSILGTAIQ